MISNIKRISENSEPSNQLINYYSKNKNRMKYQEYVKIGRGVIGSGATESTHRTLIQKRMKQSGQRCSWKVAQHMIKLTVVKLYQN